MSNRNDLPKPFGNMGMPPETVADSFCNGPGG